MVIVDTSVWIAFFRGEPSVRTTLNELLDEDSVLLPAPVWIELLSGARKSDFALLRSYLSALPRAYPEKNVWKRLETWISIASKRGRRFGIGDLMIAGICAEARAEIWSLDRDFADMASLKFVSLYRS